MQTTSDVRTNVKPARVVAEASAKTAPEEKKPGRAVLEILPDAQHGQWDEFVLDCPRASAFQTTWWYQAWGFKPIVKVLRNDEGGIVAGICYAVGTRFGTRAMVRPPCTAGNGPVFMPAAAEGRYKEITHAKEMALLAIHSLPKLGFYDLRLRPADTDVMPYLWNGFDTHTGYTYVIPSSQKGRWMEGTSKTTRKELRRATREVEEKGYRIEENPDAAAMLPLIQDTINAKQFKVERLEERFSAWWQAIREHNVGCAYLLRDRNGEALATDILIWDRHTAYSILGGIRADLRKDSRVGTILLDKMIGEAHRRDLDFDFEGSALPGVERFMRSFGGELRPMTRVVKIKSPLVFALWQTHRYFTRHCRSWVWVD
jgi:hypothetical protein